MKIFARLWEGKIEERGRRFLLIPFQSAQHTDYQPEIANFWYDCNVISSVRSESFVPTLGPVLNECFYYAENMTRSYKNIVWVWIKLEYTEKGIAESVKEFGKDYENLSYSLQLWEIDCPAKKQRILSINEYSVEGNIFNTKPDKSRL